MRRLAVATFILLTAACTDNTTGPTAKPVTNGAMHAVVLESASNFTMLPPVGRAVNPAVVFDASAPHVVEVCRTTSGDCAVQLRTYEVGGGNKNGITIGSDYFQVNVKLSDLGVTIQPNDRFAVRVRSGAQTLGGFLIVFNAKLKGQMLVEDVASPGNVSPNQNIAFKYRIGASEGCDLLNDPSVNCIQVRVTNAGGTFINKDTSAGAKFPANALPSGVSEVTLVVDRYVPNPLIPTPLPPNTFCLPDTNPQYNGCYVFTTEPHVESFAQTVEIAICPDYEAYSTLGSQINQVDLWKWDGLDESTYQPLAPVETSFMECEEPVGPVVGSAGGSSSAFALARNALRPLARLVMPSPLHAAVMRGKISPYGGGVSDFSTVGPVRRLRMETTAGDGANVMTGTTVTSSVRVLADGMQVASLNEPVANVPVRFTVTNGTGTIVSASEVMTDANGVASVQWNPGAGFNTLRAEGLNPRGESPFNIAGVWGSQVFSAVGQFFDAGIVFVTSFVSPISKPATGTLLTSDFSPLLTMLACAEDVEPRVCTTVPMAAPGVTLSPTTYHYTFASTTSMPAGAYSFTLVKDGIAFSLYTARARAPGETTAQGAADHAFTLGSTIDIAFTMSVRFFGAD
jgi:hypothetical protein